MVMLPAGMFVGAALGAVLTFFIFSAGIFVGPLEPTLDGGIFILGTELLTGRVSTRLPGFWYCEFAAGFEGGLLEINGDFVWLTGALDVEREDPLICGFDLELNVELLARDCALLPSGFTISGLAGTALVELAGEPFALRVLAEFAFEFGCDF